MYKRPGLVLLVVTFLYLDCSPLIVHASIDSTIHVVGDLNDKIQLHGNDEQEINTGQHSEKKETIISKDYLPKTGEKINGNLIGLGIISVGISIMYLNRKKTEK